MITSCKQKVLSLAVQVGTLTPWLSVSCGKNRILSLVELHDNYAEYTVTSCSGTG